MVLNESSAPDIIKYLHEIHRGSIKEPVVVKTPDEMASGDALERAAPLIDVRSSLLRAVVCDSFAIALCCASASTDFCVRV